MDNLNIKVVDGKINFKCLGKKCPQNCCGPYAGAVTGIETIGNIGFHNTFLTDEDIVKIEQNGFGFLIDILETGQKVMKLNSDHSCSAFEDGKCTIQQFKPTLCRAYPFYIDMFSGLCGIIDKCPGFGAGETLLSDMAGDINATMEMYGHWIKQINIKKL